MAASMADDTGSQPLAARFSGSLRVPSLRAASLTLCAVAAVLLLGAAPFRFLDLPLAAYLAAQAGILGAVTVVMALTRAE
jgi:hypothetical protein